MRMGIICHFWLTDFRYVADCLFYSWKVDHTNSYLFVLYIYFGGIAECFALFRFDFMLFGGLLASVVFVLLVHLIDFF